MQIQTGNQQFDDKAMMQDALMSQKFLTDDYNTYANECASPQVKEQFMSILNEEHQIQAEIFQEMQKRGWYPVKPADQLQIDQTKNKYINQNPSY
ncbi:MAG TPA: spore coat protein [Firmicutes bacterium]|nr:spore coat protein [Bacillota bacterium]